MGKNTLIGGSIWDEYSQKVQDRMNNPRHMGEFTEEDAQKANAKLIVADFGAESCGDAVRLYWLVDEKTDTIKDAKFKSFGCGTAIASSDTMVDLCIGKKVQDAVKITNLDVEFAMRDNADTPAVPPQKMHCSVMAYDVIKQAAGQYLGVDAESFEDQIIICECARISLGTIKDVIRLNDLHSVEEITQYTKAGAFCKSCVKPGGHEKKDIYLVDILEQTRAEMDRERLKNQATNSDIAFDDMTMVGQLKAVEAVLDAEIRAMLQSDGGDMEVIDIQKNESNVDIYIRYLGACNGCSSGTGATLYAIENILQEELSPNIRVMPV